MEFVYIIDEAQQMKEGSFVVQPAPENQAALMEENMQRALSDMIILFFLSKKECYIGELNSLVKEKTNNSMSMVFPYRAICRMQQFGYVVEGEKRYAPDGRWRQYYRITDHGRDYLDSLLNAYQRLTQNISNLLSERFEKGDD